MMRTTPRSGSNAGGFARAAAEELVTMQSFVTLLEQERGALKEGKAAALYGFPLRATAAAIACATALSDSRNPATTPF